MRRPLCALCLALLAGAAPAQPAKRPSAPASHPPPQAPELNAVALLAGARQVDSEGRPLDDSLLLFDGLATASAQWEPARTAPTRSAVLQLAEPFDVTRAEAVNSFSEDSYPGISTRRLRLEHGPGPAGPWRRLAEAHLKRGTQPQRFALRPARAVRYLRVTLVENYGEESWWSLAELGVYGRRTQPRAVDFTGAWQTPSGPLVLEQRGARVTGCYGAPPSGTATLEGTVEGPVLFATFLERAPQGEQTHHRGTLTLALTAEGELSGLQASEATGQHRAERWDGRPLSEAPLACERPERHLGAELHARGRVVLRGVHFEPGQDTLRPESLPVLEELARVLQRLPERRVLIEGHAPPQPGPEADAQGLSERRAARVRAWLEEAGVPPERLESLGHGASQPVLPGDSEASRAAWRRLEVSLLP